MKSSGFTLVELLISVMVIIIIGGIGTSAYVNQLERGRDQERQSDLSRIQAALERYRADNGEYPRSVQSCNSSVGNCPAPCRGTVEYSCSVGSNWHQAAGIADALVPDYLESMPVDPKNNNQFYYSYSPIGGGGGAYSHPDGLVACGKRIKCTSSAGFDGACGYLLQARLESGGTHDVCNP